MHSIALVLLALFNISGALGFISLLTPTSLPQFCRATVVMSGKEGTLFDVPVSNNGARCRYIIYEKGIEGKIDVTSPMTVGGLKSEEYMKLCPTGKMPALVTNEGESFGESDTIARYLIDRYTDVTPSFIPKTLAQRTLSNMICRHLDIYVQPIQGAMYKASPPFGTFGVRADAIADLKKQLSILEDMVASRKEKVGGPWLTGPEVSLADATFFPTAVFLTKMLPNFGVQDSEILGPVLKEWWTFINDTPTGKRIAEEINGALEGWASNKRWDGILGAGRKDDEPETIFDKILRKEIPSTVVYEDDKVYCFRDINPVAPVHILIIPKIRACLTRLSNATDDNSSVLGQMMVVAAKVAKQEGLDGFRLVINDGPKGGQEVYHLHMHLIGGRQMRWPPG